MQALGIVGNVKMGDMGAMQRVMTNSNAQIYAWRAYSAGKMVVLG